ncbi:hypothetical protein HOD41_01540 [bacterium]|jgi:hypothetical protein|nr:hypothetical protein [bacterium]
MKKLLFLLFGLLAVVGCSEDDSITDPNGNEPEVKVETVDNGDGSFTTVVDAGYMGATEFVYFSFADGEVEVIDSMIEASWDLGFRFYTIQVNGGIHGTAGIEIAYVDGVNFADVTEAPAEGWVTDVDDDGAFKVDGGWYSLVNPPYGYEVNGRIWFVHLPNGTYLKMELIQMADEAGTPGFPGFVWEIF